MKKLNRVEAYQQNSIELRQTLGFIAKVFVIANLPHREQFGEKEWIRKNGKYVLRLSAGEKYVNEKLVSAGLPYGTYARLLMMWLTTQALRTKSRKVFLKKTLSSLMKELDIQPTGGKKGTITYFKEQFVRLCCCRVAIDEVQMGEDLIGTQFFIVEDKFVKWLQDHESSFVEEDSYIMLNEKFYELIVKSSIPFDFNVITALKQSSIAIDVYIWLTYRAFTLKQPTIISWRQVQEQMGTQYSDLRNFMNKMKKVILQIRMFYPDINIEYVHGGMKIHPSEAHVIPLNDHVKVAA